LKAKKLRQDEYYAYYGDNEYNSFRMDKGVAFYVDRLDVNAHPIGRGYRWYKTLEDAVAQRCESLAHRYTQASDLMQMWEELLHLPVKEFLTEI
jgi:hypothetical protein